jgi:chromosome partitioning protein
MDESDPLDPPDRSAPMDQEELPDGAPSTSDEDETVNGSFDGPWLSQSNLDSPGGVSRETFAPTVSGSGAFVGGTGFGFTAVPIAGSGAVELSAATRVADAGGVTAAGGVVSGSAEDLGGFDSVEGSVGRVPFGTADSGRAPGGTADPGPRAMAADGDAVSQPTSAMPVYEASGGPNLIVSAAGHRTRDLDSVRDAREPEDPPLAQEAKRAVQILNPSGEIQMPRPPRTRIFCVANQKGGVGKTTSVVNIAVALALHGNRVLVVDLDPQGNASTGLDVPHHSAIPDVYDCLVSETSISDVVQAVSGIPNLWCVPATIDLAGAEIELVSMVARESRLTRAIESQAAEYDYIFIDCPPSLGLLTVNALVAAREVMIPIQCEYYALEGVQQLTNNIQLVKNHLNPVLDVTTVLLTMYDRRTRLADAVEQDVRAHFGDRVLTAVIPRNVRVSEAPSYGQSVMTYDPGSRGATSYFEAALEIATRGAQVGAS